MKLNESFSRNNRLVDLAVKASASRAVDPGFDSRLPPGDFSGSSQTSDLKLVLHWLLWQAPGDIELKLGLVGPV